MKYCPKAQTVKLGTIDTSGIVWAELGRERGEIEVATHPCPPPSQGSLLHCQGTMALEYGLYVSTKTINFSTFPPQNPSCQ